MLRRISISKHISEQEDRRWEGGGEGEAVAGDEEDGAEEYWVMAGDGCCSGWWFPMCKRSGELSLLSEALLNSDITSVLWERLSYSALTSL